MREGSYMGTRSPLLSRAAAPANSGCALRVERHAQALRITVDKGACMCYDAPWLRADRSSSAEA